MFLLFQNDNSARPKRALVNLELTDALIYVDGNISTTSVPTQAKRYRNLEDGKVQFADIVEALLSDKVDVYDMEQDPGYWKKEEHKEEAHKPTPRKTTPKK